MESAASTFSSRLTFTDPVRVFFSSSRLVVWPG